MEFARMTWKEIKELPLNTIFLLPMGPMEAHGPHLPISTDFEIAKRVAERTAELLEEEHACVMLPPLPVGSCKSLQGFPGTMSMGWKVVGNMLYDYVKSISSYGFKYFLIINFHMDIVHLKGIYYAIRRLKKENVMIAEPLSPCYFRGELFEDIKGEVHADVKETSLALYLFPEMVGDYNLKEVKVKFNVLNAMKSFRELGATEAYIGNPSAATPEYGKELFERMVECCRNAAKMLLDGQTKELPGKIKLLLKI